MMSFKSILVVTWISLMAVLAEGFLNPCSLPQESGPCRARIPRFYYNQKTGRCEMFIYGGCGGNSNNFKNIAECAHACNANGVSNPCSLPQESGPCRAHILRYYYNQGTRQCQMFIYGGCKGNSNNFETRDECANACNRVAAGHLRDYFKRLSSTHGRKKV